MGNKAFKSSTNSDEPKSAPSTPSKEIPTPAQEPVSPRSNPHLLMRPDELKSLLRGTILEKAINHFSSIYYYFQAAWTQGKPSLKPQYKFGTRFGSKTETFTSACGLAIDIHGNVHVAETLGTTDQNQIRVFQKDGTYLRSIWASGSLVFGFDGNLYVADPSKNYIYVYDPEGNFVKKFGSPGNKSGQLTKPSGIAIDQEGNLVVCDRGNDRIQVFSASGQFLRKFGKKKDREEFFLPIACGVDYSTGNIVVSESYHRVHIFSSTGQPIKVFGGFGDDDGQFNAPSGVAVDKDGKIIVADEKNFRFQIFSPEGNFLAKVPMRGIYISPTVLVLDREANIMMVHSKGEGIHISS